MGVDWKAGAAWGRPRSFFCPRPSRRKAHQEQPRLTTTAATVKSAFRPPACDRADSLLCGRLLARWFAGGLACIHGGVGAGLARGAGTPPRTILYESIGTIEVRAKRARAPGERVRAHRASVGCASRGRVKRFNLQIIQEQRELLHSNLPERKTHGGSVETKLHNSTSKYNEVITFRLSILRS